MFSGDFWAQSSDSIHMHSLCSVTGIQANLQREFDL